MYPQVLIQQNSPVLRIKVLVDFPPYQHSTVSSSVTQVALHMHFLHITGENVENSSGPSISFQEGCISDFTAIKSDH